MSVIVKVFYYKNLIVFPLRRTEYELDFSDMLHPVITKRVTSGNREEFFGTAYPPCSCRSRISTLLSEKGFFSDQKNDIRGYCGASFGAVLTTDGGERSVSLNDLPGNAPRAFLSLEEALENLFVSSVKHFPVKENDPFRSECDSIFEKLFSEDGPAASVLIAEGDTVLYDRGFGKPQLSEERGTDSDTFFNIASCSKQFTAVGILQLVGEGRLSLSDPVKKWFPEFRGDFWNRVTVSHLLSHSSGVPDKRGYLTRKQLIECDDRLAVEYLPGLDSLSFEPGTAYEYVNPTFVLCGRLIELVSGKPFADYMHERVFVPAGMRRSCYFEADKQELLPFRAHGYEMDEGEWSFCEYGQETCFATRPDGGLYTSAREFFKWVKALRTGKLLPAEQLSLAQSEITEVTGSEFSDYQNRPNTWYGYGWFLEPAVPGVSERVVYHTGDNGGFKILTATYPESQKTVLVFSARSDYDRNGLKIKLEKMIGVRK